MQGIPCCLAVHIQKTPVKKFFHKSLPEFIFYAMPKSSICSFHEYGNVVFNLVSESVQGAFPAKMASTISEMRNAYPEIFLKNRFSHTAKICSSN